MTFEKFLETFDKKKLRTKETIKTLCLDKYHPSSLEQFIFELQAINTFGYIDVSIEAELDYKGCYYEGDEPGIETKIIGYKEETEKQYRERAKRAWENQKTTRQRARNNK